MFRWKLIVRLFCLVLTLIVFASIPASAQGNGKTQSLMSDRIPSDRMKQYADQAVQWEQEYLRIDSTNPPGNELRTATFLKKILDAEGIENRVFEYAPGRADLWARIPHTSATPRRPFILMSHMDVVTSDPAHWKVPPFSGQILGGAIYGRGAQDMKSEGLAHLMVLVMLQREKLSLDRDVIFLAVSDEEADGTGTDWFIAHQRDLLGNAEFMISEGGENIAGPDGRPKYIGVDVGEKSPLWVHVVAHGKPGHASRPMADSAPNRLVRALERILAYKPPLRLLPVVEEYFKARAADEPPARAAQYRNLRRSLENDRFRRQIDADENLYFLLHTTIALTMLGGSEQTNVIPAEAWANLDVRLLPGENPKQVLETLRRVVNDPNVSVEPQSADFREANYSPTDTALYKAFRQVEARDFPETPIAPFLTSGYDENQRYRPLGIYAYGFNPYTATQEENDTEHGNDERIRVEEVRRGFRVMYDVVTRVAAKPE
jgi:acetylornithine deacetylase/succinyl-diaminopimelate desuccinylase-like protein